MKNCKEYLHRHPWLVRIVTALALNLLAEILLRRSVGEALRYIVDSPFAFAAGFLIILSTLSVSMLTRHRVYWFVVPAFIWFGLSAANFILMSVRTTPLAATDIFIVFVCLDVIPQYLNTLEIVLILIGIVLLLVFTVFMFFRSKKYPVRWKVSVPCTLSAWAACALTLVLCINTGVLSTHFENMLSACKEYGYVYTFSAGLVRRGIKKPDGFSEKKVRALVSELDAAREENSGVQPTIIYVQLESFFDTARLKGVTASADPIPNFTYLRENYPSGHVTMPYVGAGTANVEFEVLTGLSLKLFGPGEYPYKTALKSCGCESVAYDLASLGYSTHAVHNNIATFYSRDSALAALGFDTFTSIEYMENATYNVLGWSEDSSLLQPILDCIDSTDGPDFVFAISVQGHGKYPKSATQDHEVKTGGHSSGIDEAVLSEEEMKAQTISLTGFDDVDYQAQFTYYANQTHEMDAFVGNLIAELETRDEPYMVVVYGDHLPALQLEDSMLGDGTTVMESEYVIWTNFGTENVKRDLEACQLSAHALDLAGIHTGTFTAVHQYFDSDMDMLAMLGYDMLYEAPGGSLCGTRYQITDLRMGVLEIRVTGAEQKGGVLYVSGEHFTPFSVISADGKKLDTEFVSPTLLKAKLKGSCSKVCVKQQTSTGRALSQTASYSLNGN